MNSHDPKSSYEPEPAEARKRLIELIGRLTYIHSLEGENVIMRVEDLQAVADQLSALVGREQPWTWRYLRSILNQDKGFEAGSVRLAFAIEAWHDVLDGKPEPTVGTEAIQVRAKPGYLMDGAVVLARAVRCENKRCRQLFVPVVPWQRFCCPKCRREAHR